MPARKLWLPLAVTQFIDSHVRNVRDYYAESQLNSNTNKLGSEIQVELRLGKNEEAIRDFYFFLNKGIHYAYLKRIFEDMHRYNAKKVSSVSDASTAKKSIGRNTYTAARQDNVYDHTINAAKRVYELTGNGISTRNDAALLVLLHDIGKIKDLMKDLNIPLNISHEARSAQYAAQVVTRPEDQKMLAYIQDWLGNVDLDRKYKTHTCGAILEKVDVRDRIENQKKVEAKERTGP